MDYTLTNNWILESSSTHYTHSDYTLTHNTFTEPWTTHSQEHSVDCTPIDYTHSQITLNGHNTTHTAPELYPDSIPLTFEYSFAYIFLGSTLCWGSNVNTSYRFYEHGLHFGSAAQTGNKKCHLANDETEIMLKSHYAFVDGTGRRARWDRAQFGFLSSRVLQVPCKRIAIWIR